MVWQRMIQRLSRRQRPVNATSRRRRGRRLLRHETLAKRELLASDLGAITGVSFADLQQDGLTPDDERLAGVQIDLYRDVDDSGSLTPGDGAPIDSAVSDDNGMYFFRGLGVDTYIVQQQSAGDDLIAPEPAVVVINDDSGAVLTIVDDFTQTGQVVTADDSMPIASSSAAAPEAIGGFRDMKATRTSDVGILNVVADAGDDILSIGSQTLAVGSVLVQYDGDDNSTDLDPTGLDGISLGGGMPGEAVDPDAGILIEASKQFAGDMITVRIYTDANNFAVAEVDVPEDTDPDVQESVFLRYSTNFTPTGSPDFNNVGAVEFDIEVSANNDGTFSAFTVIGPNLEMQNLPNEQLMTLGGSLFNDFGGGDLTNNGFFDSIESGAQGIAVDLYAEPQGGGTIDPATQTPIDSTTTDADGEYVFTQLAAGNYLVVVPESEFAANEPLFGFLSSTGADPVSDPNDNVDNDDNGNQVAGVGIVTGEITLTPGQEPTSDLDPDPNANFTLDMGVTPTADLSVTQTYDADASNPEATGILFFDIDYDNAGPLEATGVVLTNVMPAGTSLNLQESDFGSFTPQVNGQTITVPVGTVSDDGSGSIRIALDIADGETAAKSNAVNVEADQVDPNEDDNSNTSDDVILVNTDLSIAITENTTGAVGDGDQFTYTITVTNAGPDTAEGIIATDLLPDGLLFVSGAFTSGNGTISENPVDSGDVFVDIDDLAENGIAVFELLVEVDAPNGDTLANSVSVIGSPNTDVDTSNNTASVSIDVVRSVDVAVTKTTNQAAVAGATLRYTVSVTNSGPGDARDVMVTDILDAAYTFDSLDAGSSGVTVSQDGQTLTFDVGTVTASGTTTFDFIVDIASSATGTINNQVDASTSDNDTDTSNNSDNVDVTISRSTDLALTKDVDLTTAVPGQDTLTYSFTIAHDSDSVSDSGEVTFTDMLPSGTTGVTITAPDAISSGFDTAMQTVTIVYAPVPIGQTRTFMVTASVDEDATGTIVNEGTIVVDGGDFDESNNTDSASTSLTPEFDVSLTKTADNTTPAPGDDVTYSIDISNSGPSTATGVILTDDVPAGMTFVSGTLNGQSATLDGTTVTFPSVTVGDDESLTATLVMTLGIDTSGTVTNTADVTSDPGDTDTSNNTATEDITATPLADLTVSKTVDQAGAQPGETLVYTINVSNSGVSTAVDSTAVDTLPGGVTFVSGVGPNGEALTADNGVVTVDGGDVAPDGTFQFTITATIDADSTGTLTNSVTVATTTDESDETNNTATAETIIDPFSSTIGGSVYIDANDNGIREDDEIGLSGVTITLTGTDELGNQVDQVFITDDDGNYLFEDLAEGIYEVEQTQPKDVRDGQTTVGEGATATVIDNAFVDLELGVATDAINFNFGELGFILSKRRFLASSTP